jgi:hypothetical protein
VRRQGLGCARERISRVMAHSASQARAVLRNLLVAMGGEHVDLVAVVREMMGHLPDVRQALVDTLLRLLLLLVLVVIERNVRGMLLVGHEAMHGVLLLVLLLFIVLLLAVLRRLQMLLLKLLLGVVVVLLLLELSCRMQAAREERHLRMAHALSELLAVILLLLLLVVAFELLLVLLTVLVTALLLLLRWVLVEIVGGGLLALVVRESGRGVGRGLVVVSGGWGRWGLSWP